MIDRGLGFNQEARGDDDGLPDLFSEIEWTDLGRRFALSPRQRQIARMICLGRSNRSIGQRLGLKLDTIRMHNRELFRKLGARQRIGVVVRLVMAFRNGSQFRNDDE